MATGDPQDRPQAQRPPGIFSLIVEHYWLITLPLLGVIFYVVIYHTNSYNMNWAQVPSLMKLGIAMGVVGALQLVPYLVFRKSFDRAREDVALRRDARLGVKDAQRRLRHYGGSLKGTVREQIKDAITRVEHGLSGERDLGQALSTLESLLEEHLSFARKGPAREYAESIGVAVFIALVLRAFVVEAFKIPSGSMIPTLEVGDHIFVNKFIYGVRVPLSGYLTSDRSDIKIFERVREPRRGEVVVFVYPKEPDKDFIKRIVAVAGDKVDIRGNQVYVNDQPLQREPVPGTCEYEDFEEVTGEWRREGCDAYRETNGGMTYTTITNPHSTGRGNAVLSFPLTVPPRSVFVMGDNRDNSHDSRYWGFVPYENIKGKALIIWWSSGQGGSVRLQRMFHLIHP